MSRNLDPIDFKIIEALQENARLSNKEIAARVNLSPSRCFERARRLREEGTLLGFRTSVSPASIGIGMQVLVAVSMRRLHGEDFYADFERFALGFEEVVGICQVTGKSNFLVRLAVRDATHLRQVVLDELSDHDAVATVETFVILAETERPLPILAEAS